MRHVNDEFKLLNGVGNIDESLTAAAEGEDYETAEMYPIFAKDAEAESDMDI